MTTRLARPRTPICSSQRSRINWRAFLEPNKVKVSAASPIKAALWSPNFEGKIQIWQEKRIIQALATTTPPTPITLSP